MKNPLRRLPDRPRAIARVVCEALREELATFPKPGLVSHVDSGSHPDMDADCFLRAIAAMEPFFAGLAAAGEAGAPLGDLQRIGLCAETAMLEATGGKNTHRGAIFSLGLLAAAAGRSGQHRSATLGDIVRECWAGDLPVPCEIEASTEGIARCQRHGVEGARGEARSGFPSVYRTGLPALCRALESVDRPSARVQVFFVLLASCEDTTLLKRGGAEGAGFARAEARRFLAEGGVLSSGWAARAATIHRAFVARNLTAGGVADLLAATLFVHALAPPDQASPHHRHPGRKKFLSPA